MISLAHKTLYVHIRKCGGQSIEEAFCNDLGLDWGTHRRLLMCMEKPEGWYGAGQRTAHLTAREYLEGDYLPAPLFSSFFKFATVRNPYDWVVSHYFFQQFHQKISFPKFCLRYLPKAVRKNNPLYASQSSYVVDENNQLMVDRIYQLETLKSDWEEVREKAGLDTPIGHRNAHQNRDPSLAVWTPELREKIHTLYQEDFNRFGYPS